MNKIKYLLFLCLCLCNGELLLQKHEHENKSVVAQEKENKINSRNALGINIIKIWLLMVLFWFVILVLLKKPIKIKLNNSAIFLILLNFALLVGLYIKYLEQNKCFGIISEFGVQILAGPDKDYHGMEILNLTDKVEIKDKKRDYLKISKDGTTGWVHRDSLIII